MAVPKRIKRLLEKFYALVDLYDEAMQVEDFETAQKYGAELCDFFERYGRDLNFSDEQISEMRRLHLRAEVSREEQKLAEANLEKAHANAEKAKQKYHQALLEQPPQGRKRTEH